VYSPHYTTTNSETTIVITVFILTYLIPLAAILVLWKMKLISALHMPLVTDRKRPLIILILLYAILVKKVFTPANFYELHTFFYSVILASVVAYLALFFNKKISLHMLGLGGLLGFFIYVSMYQHENYLKLIILVLLFSGLVASARLVVKAHTISEVVLGFFVGLLLQFTYLFY